MRVVRNGLLVLAGAVAGVLVLTGIALQPPVQRWALRRCLASHPEWRLRVGGIKAGFRRLELRDVTWEKGPLRLRLPRIEAEVATIDLVLGRPAAVHLLSARGWTADFTPPPTRLAGPGRKQAAAVAGPPPRGFSLVPAAQAAPPGAPPAARTPFRGILSRLVLPNGDRFEKVSGEGELLLPGSSGGAPVRVRLAIDGGNLVPGGDARFTFELSQRFTPASAAVGSIASRGVIEANVGEDGALRRLELRVRAEARGGKIPEGVRLSVDFGAARADSGESYTVSLVRDGKAVASILADFLSASPRLAGRWTFNLSAEDIRPFILGRPLPAFTLVGKGRFDTDDTFELAHVSGDLDASLDHLSLIWPELSGVGPTRVGGQFDLTQRRGLWRIDHLDGSLSGRKPVLTVHALQPFAFNLGTGELQVADATRDLLRVSLQRLPVEWLGPLVHPWRLSVGSVEGELAASARDGGLSLHSLGPLRVAEVSADRQGRRILEDIDLSLGLSANYTPLGWQAEADVRAEPAAHRLEKGADSVPSPSRDFFLSAKVGRLAGSAQPVKLAGRFGAHLPAWTGQPGFPSGDFPGFLASGELAGDFSASLADERSFQVRLALADLVVGEGASAQAYPRVSAEMEGDLGRDRRFVFTLPITLEAGDRKSDLTLDGTLAPTRDGLGFDARAASSRLHLEDARLLGAVSLLRRLPGLRRPRGRLLLSLQRVEEGKWTALDVSGTVYALPGAVDCDDIRARLGGGGHLALNGSLGYGADQPDPYALQAEVSIDGFEAAPVLRALNPDRPPVIDGRCNLTLRLDGRGPSPKEALGRARGDFTLTSESGVVRALRAEVVDDIRQSPSRLSEAVDTVTSLFGKSNVARTYIDKQGKVVIQITDAFKEIHYDQLRVAGNRDDALDLKLSEFALISPEIRLAGKGQIRHEDGVPFASQPLELTITVGARGRLAGLMNEVGLLGGRRDDLGYTRVTEPITLGGSLDEIDQTEWKDLLIKAAMRKAAGGLIDKLLGK